MTFNNIFWFFILLTIVACHHSTPETSYKPNIILIMADDPGYGDLSLWEYLYSDAESRSAYSSKAFALPTTIPMEQEMIEWEKSWKKIE